MTAIVCSPVEAAVGGLLERSFGYRTVDRACWICGLVVSGWLFQAEKAGLKEQIGAIEQRLKLAADASGASERAKDELEKQFLAYKSEVAAKGKEASPAKVYAAIVKVASGNTNVRSSLSAAIKDIEFAQYGGAQET